MFVWNWTRLGVGSLVLEQGESLRTGGTSLTLFKNGWKVLDALGVGNDLRTQFIEIQGFVINFFCYKFLTDKTAMLISNAYSSF